VDVDERCLNGRKTAAAIIIYNRLVQFSVDLSTLHMKTMTRIISPEGRPRLGKEMCYLYQPNIGLVGYTGPYCSCIGYAR